MVRYVHGSQDSTDLDVVYVFPALPSPQECKEFCSGKEENRNIIVVRDGTVTECYKGTPDEINNSLIETYFYHPQDYDLILRRRVPRDKILKSIRAVRIILSYLSRSSYRKEIKEALKSSSWEKRLEVLGNIELENIDFSNLPNSREDTLKVIAFQIGQVFGLLEGYELYTKSSIGKKYILLDPYLKRTKDLKLFGLQMMLKRITKRLKDEIDCTNYDIKNERKI